MKNTNNRSGSVSAETTKETNLKVFGNKDVAEMSIKVLEDLLDKEKGPVRPYTDGDITHRFKEFLSREYDPNSFVPIIDRKKGIVYAASIGDSASKKEQIESDFASGKEVDCEKYCSLCKKYMKPINNGPGYGSGVECNGFFVLKGEIPCKHFEAEQQEERAYGKVIERAIQNSPWRFSPSKNWKHSYSIVTPNEDPDGSILIADKLDSAVAEHICKTHNDWRNFKMKNGEKKIKKGNLRRLENLAWRMKTFKKAFKVIEKNKYLGFDSIKIWIEQNEADVNQWIFTKWLKNSSNYEDWTWFFHNQGTSLQTIPSNKYFELCDSCEYIDYFRFGNYRSMNGVPEGEWDSYTFHQEYESKLFADGKDFTAALVLEKMFEFAEEYVKNTGWITAEMADKYHIDMHLVSSNNNSDVLLDKMDPDNANRVRRIVEESDDKLFEKNPELKGEDANFKKPLEQRVDNLEKMIKDIWTNICADKSPAETEDNLTTEIINKKPVLEGQKCSHCKNSKNGCEFYDKGTCHGIVYPTYPPQYDKCEFDK